MTDLSAQLDVAPGQESLRDSIMRKIAENQVQSVELQGVLALPATPGVGVATLKLPELPEGAQWLLGAASNVQAKLAETGSSSTTQVRLTNGADIATLDVANTVGDDTFANGSSISSVPLAGGTILGVDVDQLAPAAVGPITIRVVLDLQKILTGQITDLQ